MKVRDFKNNTYNELATVTKALANPHRLEIIELLSQGSCSVEYIADHTRLSVANASQHLQVLKNARLAKSEKKGKYSYYSLANAKVYGIWKSLVEFGFAQNAEIRQLLHDFRHNRQSLETVTLEDLQQRIENDEVLVLDVRPEEEYEEGHIAGAVSIPSDQLEDHIDDLPKNKQIVAYCRGPLCAMADDAVNVLKQHGFDSKRLEEGYPEWIMQTQSD